MPLTKLSEIKRGEISRLSLAGLNFGSSSLFVTAVRNSEDKLQLLVWAASANGEAEVRSTHTTDGTIKEVAIAVLGEKRFVTALRDSNDQLRVIAWQASSDGRSIDRLGTATGSKINRVSAAGTHSSDQVFVAARNSEGKLEVWSFEIGTNTVTAKGNETFGDVSVISVASGLSHGTAMRDGQGKLRLINFWPPVLRGGMGHGEDIADVRVTSDGGAFSGKWFTFSIGNGPTAVKSGALCTHRLLVDAGQGKIIGWEMAGTSLTSDFKRTKEVELTGRSGLAGKADLVLLRSPAFLVTGHLGFGSWCKFLPKDRGEPHLRLIVWDPISKTAAIIKTAEAELGGDYAELGITEIARNGDQQRVVVALQGRRGELKVTVWGITH